MSTFHNPVEPEIVDPGDTGSGRFAREAGTKPEWKSGSDTEQTENNNGGNQGFDFRKYLTATRRQLTVRGILALLTGAVLVLMPNLSVITTALFVRFAGIITAIGAFLSIWRLLRHNFSNWKSFRFLSLLITVLCSLAVASSPFSFMGFIIQFFGLYLALSAIFFPFFSGINFGFRQFLLVLLGFFIAYNPFSVLRFISIAIGILLILFGVTLLSIRARTKNV